MIQLSGSVGLPSTDDVIILLFIQFVKRFSEISNNLRQKS